MNRAESGQYFKPEVNIECKATNKYHILQRKSGLLVEFNSGQWKCIEIVYQYNEVPIPDLIFIFIL